MVPAAPPTEHGAKSSSFRASLRRQRIAARQNLPPDEHAARSLCIDNHLWAWLEDQAPAAIAFCWPYRAEIDLRPLIARLLGGGWLAGLPVLQASDQPMSFRRWTPSTPLAVDRYGISYPAVDLPMTPELLLVPVNAFDATGFRLGYGGGYFDRTLAALVPRPLTIGIGFELARVDDIEPEAHDIPLDAVVTENGMQTFSTRLSPPTASTK